MLEIIALIFITKFIGKLAIQKGQPPMPWKVRTVLCWIAGEFMGVAVGILIFHFQSLLQISLLAIPFAIAGFHIMKYKLEQYPDSLHSDIDSIGNDFK